AHRIQCGSSPIAGRVRQAPRRVALDHCECCAATIKHTINHRSTVFALRADLRKLATDADQRHTGIRSRTLSDRKSYEQEPRVRLRLRHRIFTASARNVILRWAR